MDEDSAIKLFQQLSPALVLSCENLRMSFRSFLSRGTIAERKQLFNINTQHTPRKPTAANTPQASFRHQVQHHQAKQSLGGSAPPKIPDTSRANASKFPPGHFSSQPHDTRELLLAKIHDTGSIGPRPKNFINVGLSYVSPATNPIETLTSFQINWNLFSKGESRFSHLYYGHKQAENAGAMLSCLSRLILVLMRHELDYRGSMVDKSQLTRGRGRTTLALEELSQELSIEKIRLKDDNARATSYYKLIEECGPGDLATLGSNNNHAWEKILKSEDVSSLILFRHCHFPEIEAAARELDFPVAKLMIEVLKACGWGFKELAGSKTRLICQLGHFIDIKRLIHGDIVEIKKGTLNTPLSTQNQNTSGTKRKRSPLQSSAEKQDSIQEQNDGFKHGDKYAFPPNTLDNTDSMARISNKSSSMLSGKPTLHHNSAIIISDASDNDAGNVSQSLVYPHFGKKKAVVETQDTECLHRSDGLLNDNLIGFYIRFLEDHLDRANSNAAKRTYFFSTHFYTTLTDCPRDKRLVNYSRVQKWTKEVDIFQYDYIVVPINKSVHWYTIIICHLPKLYEASVPYDKTKTNNDPRQAQDPVFITLDSMNFNHTHEVGQLQQYLAEEAKSKKGIEISTRSIGALAAQSIPQQSNASDCGLYLLAYIEKFVQDPDQFTSRIIQKEMSIKTDWPCLKSKHLRSNLCRFLRGMREEEGQLKKGSEIHIMADRWPISFLLGESESV